MKLHLDLQNYLLESDNLEMNTLTAWHQSLSGYLTGPKEDACKKDNNKIDANQIK